MTHFFLSDFWREKRKKRREDKGNEKLQPSSHRSFLQHKDITMAPSSTNLALLTAAGATAIYLAARTLNKSSSTEQSLDPEDCIQPDDVIAVFDDLFLHMQSVLAQLSQQIQQIQMSGQSIPEPQLRQLLKGEFERALLARQKEIYDKHEVDEDCLQEATWEFMENGDEFPKVKACVERFQKLYENVTGERVVGRRPGGGVDAALVNVQEIPKEVLLEAASVYFDALTSAMGGIVTKFKSQGQNLRDPSVAQQLQMEFAAVANDAGEEALKQEGITLDGFKAAIEKYSSDPDVGRSLAMLQMKQQQQLMALGVPM